MIKEGNISIEFNGKIIKYDESNFYREKVMNCQETKAVDVLGIFEKKFFILELKDFRGSRIENKKRLKNGELVKEFSQKVRDTIAGLTGAYMSNAEELKEFYSFLFTMQTEKQILAVLLYEEDNANNDFQSKNKIKVRNELKIKIEQSLKFLNIKCLVKNISELNQINGWTIS